jgi:hypothetical protein
MNRLVAVSIIGLPIVAGIPAPAGASTAATARPNGVTPTVKILGTGSSAVFKPTALTVPEDKASGGCPADFIASFNLDNKETRTAYLTQNGSPFLSLPAGETDASCYSGLTAGMQFVIGLTNKKHTKMYASTLTITLSD